MGRGSKRIKEEREPVDEIARLTEWQEHQYDPGYHIGLHRVRRPFVGYNRFPVMYFAVAAFWILIGTIVLICAESRVVAVLGASATYLYAIFMMITGIRRLRKKTD